MLADMVWAEAGLCAQGMEKEGLFSGGPVASWWVERWRVRRFLVLGRTGEVVARGGDVLGEVLGEIDVAFCDGQGRGFRFLVCICHVGGVCPEVVHGEKITTENIRSVGDLAAYK